MTEDIHRCDDIDPLGILGERNREHQGLRVSIAEVTTEPRGNILSDPRRDLSGRSGDPRDKIDAMLQQSKDVRELVSSRQASVLHAYSNESRELDKQLALFPPTYHQFLAVRAKATCRRRQRSATLDTGRKDSHPSSVSHSLNFHLTNGVHVADRNTDYQHFDRVHDDVIEGTIDMQNCGPSVGVEREARLDSDYFHREEGVERAGGDDSGYCSAWPAGQSPPKSHVALEDIIESVTTAEECRKVKRGGVMDRRWSTRARHSSVMRNAASTQAIQLETESPHGERPRTLGQKKSGDLMTMDVEALRRSKIRGRGMVFALLEASRVEEEEMEETVFGDSAPAGEEGKQQRNATFKRLDEARVRNAREFELLMEEYDPRPSNCNRECTLEKLRKNLPWPSPTRSTATGRGTNTTTNPGSVSAQDVSCIGHRAYGMVGKGVWRDETSGTNRSQQEPLGGIMQNSANIAGLDAEITQGNVDSEVHKAVRVEHDDAEGRVEPEEPAQPVVGEAKSHGIEMVEPANVANVGEGKVDDYSRCVSDTDVPIRPTTAAADVGVAGSGGEDSDTAQGDRTGGGTLTIFPVGKERGRSPRKKPTLPDPNAINGAVMQDPFNMDHMKDLPGLVGGHSGDLSLLVSEAVSYTDPAFPNMEFHRRSAMDKAGYFMPGYKLKVSSPGADAGAYWLERRQSYRVKMTDPALSQHGQHHHPQSNPSKARHNGLRRRIPSSNTRLKSKNASSASRCYAGRHSGTKSSTAVRKRPGTYSSLPEESSRMRMRKGGKKAMTRGRKDASGSSVRDIIL